MPNIPGYSRRSAGGKTHRVRPHWRAPTSREVEASIRRFLRTLGLPVKTIRTQSTRPRSPEQLRVSLITKRAALEAAVPVAPVAIALAPVTGGLSLAVGASLIGANALYHRRRSRMLFELDPGEYARELWRDRRELLGDGAKWVRRRTRPVTRWLARKWAKKKAAVKAEFKRQLWVVGYKFVPGLRFLHGRQVTSRRRSLGYEQSRQARQATWLADTHQSICDRQELINTELAKTDKADARYLRGLRAEQAAEVSAWMETADNQALRQRILRAERKAIRVRESALREAGWKPKKQPTNAGETGKDKRSKTTPSIGSQRRDIKPIAKSPFGAADDDSLDALLATFAPEAAVATANGSTRVSQRRTPDGKYASPTALQ